MEFSGEDNFFLGNERNQEIQRGSKSKVQSEWVSKEWKWDDVQKTGALKTKSRDASHNVQGVNRRSCC